ncbi:MAG: hypothetical protein QOE06_2364 [Thermoleophilaceae bacterium]|nr:hypothetical protein [Thermoleophilaceae bacterium]
MAAPLLHDLACVVHLHSTYSDGTGTVDQIVAAGASAGVDVVMLTDHDTLAARDAGYEGWHGSVLLLVGEEVSPGRRDHTLVFGAPSLISNELSGAEIVEAASSVGALSFAAHPFSRGSERFRRLGEGMPHTAVGAPGLTGIELWSFVTDTAERIRSVREGLRFAAAPLRVVDHPPARNMVEWDRMCLSRRVVALGGLDAHQIGLRVGGRVPLRLMGYARSFRQLRTHVLVAAEPSGVLDRDRALVYDALRSGCCYLAMDSVAPARGFAFWGSAADGSTVLMGAEAAPGDWTLHVRLPRPASLRLLRDGVVVAAVSGAALDHPVSGAGVWRVEASLPWRERPHTWIVSNPVYLRG